MSDKISMMKFFSNLNSIAENLCRTVKNGQPLPEGAAEATARFNDIVQELERLSQEIRQQSEKV